MFLVKLLVFALIFCSINCTSTQNDAITKEKFQLLIKYLQNIFPPASFHKHMEKCMCDKELLDFARYVQLQNFSEMFRGFNKLPSIQQTIMNLEEQGAIVNGNLEVNRIGQKVQKMINHLANGVGAFNIPKTLKDNGGISKCFDELSQLIPNPAVLKMMKKSSKSYKVLSQIYSMIDEKEVQEYLLISENIQNVNNYLLSKNVDIAASLKKFNECRNRNKNKIE